MSKFGAWVPALVMLAAGFAGGYLFGAGDGTGEIPARLEADDGENVPQPTASRALTAAGDAGPALATNEEQAALRAALEQLPAPEVPRGTGVITGVIKTLAGVPLAGVKVKATPSYPPDTKPDARKRWEEQPIEEVVRSTVARFWWHRQARRETVTGADGTFRFEELTSGAHQVMGEHDDYMIQPVDHQMAWQAKPGANLEYRARAVVSVTIEILLPDGSVPERVQARFQSSSRGWGTGWSPQNKTVKQEPGTYQLEVTAGASDEYKAETQTVVLELGEPQSLTIQLTERPVLRGNLVYPAGQSFERTQVYLARLGAGEQPDPARLKSSSQNSWVQRGFRRGSDFAFNDLSPGRYALGAARSNRGDIVVIEIVQVGDGLTEQDLEIPPLSREEYVVLHVLGPDGEPVPDVQVRTGYRSKGGNHSGGGSVLKRPDGSLWVLHRASGSTRDPAGRYFVSVTSSSYGTLEETYALGPQVELALRFGRPGSLDVHVAGVAGTRFEGRVNVRVSWVKEGQRERSVGRRGNDSNKPDASGRYTQAGLQPGTYRINLSIKSARNSNVVLSETVEISSGANTLKLKLPELMSVTILGGEGSVSIRAKTTSREMIRRGSFYGSADANGRTVFDAVPAGAYIVRSGRKQAEFTLPGATEIELR